MEQISLTLQKFQIQASKLLTQIFSCYSVLSMDVQSNELNCIEHAIACLDTCLFQTEYSQPEELLYTTRKMLCVILQNLFHLKETSQTLKIRDNVVKMTLLLDKVNLADGICRTLILMP